MDINLNLYRTFYYVCEFKNITKVAEYLYLTQPAITKKIKNLEEQLGKKLIVSSTRGIELTEEGKFLYHNIKPIIEKLIELEFNFKENDDVSKKTIKISAGHSLVKSVLLECMVQFNKIHSNVKFEIVKYDFQESMQRLREGKLDLIFFCYDELIEDYKDIMVEHFMDIEDVFIVNRKNKELVHEEISVLELNNYPIIIKSAKDEGRNTIEKYYKKAGVEFQPKYEVSSNWIIEEYVKLNLGVGFAIKNYIKKQLKNGEYIEIKLKEPLVKRKMYYAIKKNNVIKQNIQELLSIIKKNCN